MAMALGVSGDRQMDLGDVIQLGILITLISTLLGVLWYANEARKQVQASLGMTDEMHQARLDELRPVLVLERPSEQEFGTGGEAIKARLSESAPEFRGAEISPTHFYVRNVGRGPAINISYRADLAGIGRLDTLAVGELSPLTRFGVFEGFARVNYEDVFRRRFETYCPVSLGSSGVRVGAVEISPPFRNERPVG
jgi:hypothetical protein